MKKISLWAKHHPLLSRISVVLIKLVLLWMACFTGQNLLDAGLLIPVETGYGMILLFLSAVFLYPASNTEKKRSYAWRKTCDLVLSASSFVLIVTLVNTGFFVPHSNSSYASTPASSLSRDKKPTAEEILNSLKYRDKSSLTRKEKRVLKQEFNLQLKKYVVAKITGNKKDANKSLLILVTIIGAVGLLILLSSLVCSLSCSGADAAAVIVGILGLAAIIWGVIAIVQRINRGPRRTRAWKN